MIAGTSAFCPLSFSTLRHSSSLLFARRSSQQEQDDISFLLQEFKTHSGEVLNPYKILKVSRNADFAEIKTSYRNLSRRYHPDGMRHKDILPGSCNNEDDVREEWERIKLAYEILKDNKRRKRYDRHEMLADPNAAMQRAALNTLGKGIQGVGKGIVTIGAFAVQLIVKNNNEKENVHGSNGQDMNGQEEQKKNAW